MFAAHDTDNWHSYWANTWDEDLDFTVPTNYVPVAVYSYHNNKKE